MLVVILIQLLKDLIDDLAAMFIINAALGQEIVHLVTIDLAVAVSIQLAELSTQINLLVLDLLLLSVTAHHSASRFLFMTVFWR